MYVHSQWFAWWITGHKWSEPAWLKLSDTEIVCNLEKVLSHFKLNKFYIKNAILSQVEFKSMLPFEQGVTDVSEISAFMNLQIRIIYILFLICFLKILTSPAPWKRMIFSERRVLVIRREANRPATATDAVPWISSLNVQYFSRYLSRKRNALWFPKSSNWKIERHINWNFHIIHCLQSAEQIFHVYKLHLMTCADLN